MTKPTTPDDMKFTVQYTKPQSSLKYTGMGFFYQPNKELYLSLCICSHELVIGWVSP